MDVDDLYCNYRYFQRFSTAPANCSMLSAHFESGTMVRSQNQGNHFSQLWFSTHIFPICNQFSSLLFQCSAWIVFICCDFLKFRFFFYVKILATQVHLIKPLNFHSFWHSHSHSRWILVKIFYTSTESTGFTNYQNLLTTNDNGVIVGVVKQHIHLTRHTKC